jgi:hypothetical protein
LTDGFGENEYDLVLISNVTHCESEKNNLKLVEKAYQALRPGGRLVINDYVTDENRTGSLWTATLAIHLLVFTGRGNVYTLKEYGGWMRQKGFRDVAHRAIAVKSLHPSTAVIGRKSRTCERGGIRVQE